MIPNHIIEQFVEAACVPIGPGAGSHGNGGLEKALALLEQYPSIASETLYTAAILGEEKILKEKLSDGTVDVNSKTGPRNWDALTYLCFSRFLRLDPSRRDAFTSAAKILLDAGANAGTGFQETGPYPDWEPVLYGAAGIAFHAGVTKVLLEHGADPNENEVMYHSPETYQNDAMIALIESGKLTQDSLASMLLRKSDYHDIEGAKLLLAAGADPNYLTMWGYTALHQALRRDNRLTQIELLLDYGADPLLPDKHHGHSAVSTAIYRGRKDVLQAMLNRGFIIRVSGFEQLIYACAMNDLELIKRMTAEDPHLFHMIRVHGGRLLSMFAGTANAEGVECLLDLGVPVTALYDGDGYFGIPADSTALHVAAWKAWHEVVKVLIDRGAPVNARDGNGHTALQLAVKACTDSYWTWRRETTSIRLLLDAGASKEGITLPTGYDDADKLLRE